MGGSCPSLSVPWLAGERILHYILILGLFGQVDSSVNLQDQTCCSQNHLIRQLYDNMAWWYCCPLHPLKRFNISGNEEHQALTITLEIGMMTILRSDTGHVHLGWPFHILKHSDPACQGLYFSVLYYCWFAKQIHFCFCLAVESRLRTYNILYSGENYALQWNCIA